MGPLAVHPRVCPGCGQQDSLTLMGNHWHCRMCGIVITKKH